MEEQQATEAAASVQAGDPGAPVKVEVERGMASMVEQHTTWLELCAAGQRGEEFDWRTAELLSCLRAIEWDLQDLEDAMSIVEGNRIKFAAINDDALKARKDFIDMVRSKIDGIRTSVQESSKNEGHVAAKKGLAAKVGAPNTIGKGYGKLPKEHAGSDLPSTPKGLGGGADGSPFTKDDGNMPEEMQATRRRRPWYACCCSGSFNIES